MKSLRLFATLLFLTLFYACQNDDIILENTLNDSISTKCVGVDEGIKIAILSDIHVMDPSLLVKEGSAFQAYLDKDPKLLKYSSKILEATVRRLVALRPDLVLIAGDLTKDGERISHENVARILRQLTLHGIKVVVTVGNHDVNNPEAVRYIKDRKVPVPTVQANKIPQIYANFGFRNAISRDPNSLSYVIEPIKDLWIITIDANEYYLNTGPLSTGSGIIKSETMNWIKAQLAKAQSKGKKVIGMMHHGLIEHYAYQQMIDHGYVLDNTEAEINGLIDAGLRIVLTGHYHANDITKRVTPSGNFVFDVETGSTAAYPCTYRLLTITGNNYSFKPQSTTALMWPGFDAYARTFLSSQLKIYFTNLLQSAFLVPEPYASDFAPYFVPAAMAHFAGDEVMPDISAQTAYLNAVDASGTLSLALGTLWSDINTQDNIITINVVTGAVN